MIKHLIFIPLFFNFLFVIGQTKIKCNCEVLQLVIYSKDFRTHFCNCKNETIIILDTANRFNNCVLKDSCNRIINLSNEIIELKPDRQVIKVTKSKVVIYRFENENNKWMFYFWKPSDNTNLVLQVKRKDKKYRVTKISEGVF
jgi:hypothetical protein